MRYQGSEALNIDFAEGGEALEQAARPSFQVLPGGGLDARARKGVSAQFIANVRTVVVLAAVLIAIGLVRVAISSATVVALSNNSTLRSEVSDAKNLNDDLKIERAVLSSNSRIARIATQNYGMVLSSDAMTVEVGEAAEAEQAAAEEAQAAAEQAQQAADESAAAVAAEQAAAQQAGDASYVLDPASYAASLLSADGDAAQSVAEGGAYCDVA